ncbi:MAG: hydroxysqualene dehydroxylase HpnE [Candidatus Dormibacteraceae bacterium]
MGAGLAGLAAATELGREGFAVDLFERGRLLGGKATSLIVDGVEVDNGQHVYLGCCTEFIDFVESLGMGDTLHTQERFEALVFARGRAPSRLAAGSLPAPWHLMLSFARYRHLGWAGKLQVARALAGAGPGAAGSGSFAAWLAERGQGEAARRGFWDPFFVPALNAPLDEVSAEAGLFVLRTAFLADARAACFGYSKVPLARVAEAAAGRLHAVHLRTAVTGLWPGAGEVRGVELKDGSRLPFEGVVLAVPPSRLARLLGQPAAYGVFGLERFTSQPIVDVHLWYEGAGPAFDFAAILESPVQWVFVKGPGYLVCSLSAAADEVGRPAADLIALSDRELRAAIPALGAARLLRGAATRDPEATFVSAPGLRRPGTATSAPNLTLAGAWTDTGWPATMESAVRSGRSAARLLADAVAPEVTVA